MFFLVTSNLILGLSLGQAKNEDTPILRVRENENQPYVMRYEIGYAQFLLNRVHIIFDIQ